MKDKNEKMLQKIVAELEEIKILSHDEGVRAKTEILIGYIKNSEEFKSEMTFKDLLYEKMKESQNNNPDLHLKLYMLFRELENNKIDEKTAKELYENYSQMYPADTMLF